MVPIRKGVSNELKWVLCTPHLVLGVEKGKRSKMGDVEKWVRAVLGWKPNV